MLKSKTNLFLTSLLLLLFSSCSDSESEPEIPVTSIEIIPASIILSEGETYDLSISIKPNEASGTRVRWISSAPKVATVVDGKVTAISEGTATIRASAGNCQSGCKVTVCKWIDPEFAKVLQEKGYIKDATTVRPSEVENLTVINVSGTSENRGTLTSLKGIEYFSSLERLNCSYNNLTAFDVSKNTQLTDLVWA